MRDYVPTPAELLAALGIPSGLQEEAGTYISGGPPWRDSLYAPFGAIETHPGYLAWFRALAH